MINPNELEQAKQVYDTIAPMPLRDIAAVAAMAAMLANPMASREIARDAEESQGHCTGRFDREIAMNAYDIADAMLWAREVSAADNRAMKEGGAE